jgi:hypothetical protein
MDGYKPIPASGPVKCKQKHQLPEDPPYPARGSLVVAMARWQPALPQLNGGVSILGSDVALPLSMPPPLLPLPMLLPTILPPTTLTPPADQSSEKSSCCICKINKIFNFDLRQCIECLKKMICVNCQSSTSDYG